MSQSPSLRGSGRFSLLTPAWPGRARRSLNPLHCGAVVASRPDAPDAPDAPASQSPSLRGSGRFRRPRLRCGGGGVVSIPFIAGQWSLRSARARQGGSARASQSPSLRGSGRFHTFCSTTPEWVVESQSPSLRGSGRFPPGGPPRPVRKGQSQSPSLRGSGRFRLPPPQGGAIRLHVSIPFIAGQWSLRRQRRHAPTPSAASQSPSLRGSGRFTDAGKSR